MSLDRFKTSLVKPEKWVGWPNRFGAEVSAGFTRHLRSSHPPQPLDQLIYFANPRSNSSRHPPEPVGHQPPEQLTAFKVLAKCLGFMLLASLGNELSDHPNRNLRGEARKESHSPPEKNLKKRPFHSVVDPCGFCTSALGTNSS